MIPTLHKTQVKLYYFTLRHIINIPTDAAETILYVHNNMTIM